VKYIDFDCLAEWELNHLSVASNDLYEQQQNYPSETANHRSRTCQTNRDPTLSVDSRFDGHERFRQQKPDHHTGGGVGYLQEVWLYFGTNLT
jgi:hypothetical protein